MLTLGNFLFGKRDNLIRIRLAVNVITFIHLVLVAAILLTQDFSSSKDPILHAYVRIKWKVLTAWFNLLTAPYLLMSIYCDWHELNHKGTSKNVVFVNKIRHFLFSSVILPVTTFGDITFWRLYNKDRTLLMPLSADEFISTWNQHSMHTVSLIFVIFDLACVPRKRPKSMAPQIYALLAFLSLYLSMCAHSIVNGEYIYPGIRLYSTPKLFLICAYIYIECLFYYLGQWFVVDMIWNQNASKYKFLKNIIF